MPMSSRPVPRHPVFVVGMPRSGTTLLSRLLGAHPGLVMAPETHYFTRCWTGVPVADTADALRMLDRLFQQPGVQDMALTPEEKARVRDHVQSAPDPTHGDVLRALLDTYAARSGAPAWGEKTPDHLRFVPEMTRQFPEAVVVAIVRDPRDVCLSLQSMPWSRATLPEQAWTWRTYARLVEQYRHDYEGRFYALRYEDLIAEPKASLRDVCAFLGTSFQSVMLGEQEEDMTQPFDAEREPWKAKSTRPIDASNREKWRTQMPEAERVIVERIAGRWLAANGYARPPTDWRPALAVQVLRQLGAAALQWVRRTVHNVWGGHTFSGDAAPRWKNE